MWYTLRLHRYGSSCHSSPPPLTAPAARYVHKLTTLQPLHSCSTSLTHNITKQLRPRYSTDKYDVPLQNATQCSRLPNTELLAATAKQILSEAQHTHCARLPLPSLTILQRRLHAIYVPRTSRLHHNGTINSTSSYYSSTPLPLRSKCSRP